MVKIEPCGSGDRIFGQSVAGKFVPTTKVERAEFKRINGECMSVCMREATFGDVWLVKNPTSLSLSVKPKSRFRIVAAIMAPSLTPHSPGWAGPALRMHSPLSFVHISLVFFCRIFSWGDWEEREGEAPLGRHGSPWVAAGGSGR